MKILAILAFLLGVLAMVQFVPRDPVDAQKAQAIALNYAVYRNEVYRYVFPSNRAPGDISLVSLSLPAGWTPLRPWAARVENQRLYVWGPASADEIAAVRELFWGSLAIGRADGGHLEPSFAGVTPVPVFVPNGSLVSVVSTE